MTNALTRTIAAGVSVAFVVVILMAGGVVAADPVTVAESDLIRATTIEQSPLAKKLVSMSEAQLKKLKQGKERGLLELTPVVLPEDPYIVGKNTHFGWPVATRVGKTIVIVYLRRRSHYLAPQFDKDSSGMMVTRSLDGGRR